MQAVRLLNFSRESKMMMMSDTFKSFQGSSPPEIEHSSIS